MVSELQSRCAKKARDRRRVKEQETGRQAESRGQQTDGGWMLQALPRGLWQSRQQP